MLEWTWEPDDFAALWFSDANDRFPNPLRFTSRFAYRDDVDAHRAAVRERYSVDEFEQIELALHTLGTSEVRIQIFGGTTEHPRGTGERRMYRIVGARNLYHAVVLSQTTTDHSDGPIRLRICRPDHLPTRLVNALPVRDPGKQPPAIFHPQDLIGGSGSYLDDIARSSPRERYQRLLRRPTDGAGSAQLYTGAVNTLTSPWHILQWYDITDDGRYTEQRTRDHIAVRPTTPHELAAYFTDWIDRAILRLQEDDEDTW